MENLLQVDDLAVYFSTKIDQEGFFSKKAVVKAVDGVSLQLKKGEILGLVGESGCGKSTLARALVGLSTIKRGKILFEGKDINDINKNDMHKKIQMIFQSPQNSLDPRMTIKKIVSEPLKIHYPKMSTKEVTDKVIAVLNEVGLSEQFLNGLPHELSGGQCQRVGIARALILEPQILVCDEPISALDVSIQSQIINLIKDLRDRKKITILFIAHDLAVVRHISDNILVMYLGKTMEYGSKDVICDTPSHPYTEGLIASVPIPDPRASQQKNAKLIIGDIPSPINPPSGCVFRTRCPISVEGCANTKIGMKLSKSGSLCACILRTDKG